ncbi:MAG: hypothetical protein KBF73_11705 [Flavobacteriales bacterium]|nr:hypothetical protein [Flavobacteriales bacterium]
METPLTQIEELVGRTETYGRTSYELAKLQSLETTTTVASSLVARLSVVVVLTLFVLVFNIGIALWLGELLGKNYFGFFIVAAFYLIAGIVLHYFLHGWIKDLIITQALK